MAPGRVCVCLCAGAPHTVSLSLVPLVAQFRWLIVEVCVYCTGSICTRSCVNYCPVCVCQAAGPLAIILRFEAIEEGEEKWEMRRGDCPFDQRFVLLWEVRKKRENVR